MANVGITVMSTRVTRRYIDRNSLRHCVGPQCWTIQWDHYLSKRRRPSSWTWCKEQQKEQVGSRCRTKTWSNGAPKGEKRVINFAWSTDSTVLLPLLLFKAHEMIGPYIIATHEEMSVG